MRKVLWAFIATALLTPVSYAQHEIHQVDAGLTAAVSADQLRQYAPAATASCPDQWKAFENDIRLERQVAADNGASFYIPAQSQEELIHLVLGNPYVEPLRIDHAVPVIDDELSIWIAHDSKPSYAAKQVWVLGYRDPNNVPGRQFSVTTAALANDFGLFTLEVRYRNIEAPDAHTYVTIGGAGMCSGNALCGPEIRSWDGTNRTLRAAKVWRSVLKVPQCQQLALDRTMNTQEWFFEVPSPANAQGVKTYVHHQ